MRRSQLSAIGLLFSSVALSAACSSMQASAKREPLVVPPAPPRVIAPVPAPPSEEPVAVHEPVPPLPRAPRPSRETPRTDPKPAPPGDAQVPVGPTEAESQPKPATPAPAPVAPAPELRTVETPDDGEATRQVRDTIERAGRTLAGIDYRALPKPSQVQYDMAKRFIEQSEEALKTRNFTAAKLMAEKAATIAKELSGR